jgi:hypothetical protein
MKIDNKSKVIDKIINKIFVQKKGIRKKPDKKVHIILQAVEIAYKFHIVVPELLNFSIFNFAT